MEGHTHASHSHALFSQSQGPTQSKEKIEVVEWWRLWQAPSQGLRGSSQLEQRAKGAKLRKDREATRPQLSSFQTMSHKAQSFCRPWPQSLGTHSVLRERWGGLSFPKVISKKTMTIQVSSAAQLYPTLCDPRDGSTPGLPVLHHNPELFKLMSIESLMPSNNLILCPPLLLLSSVFPSIWVFSRSFPGLFQVAKVLELQL